MNRDRFDEQSWLLGVKNIFAISGDIPYFFYTYESLTMEKNIIKIQI